MNSTACKQRHSSHHPATSGLWAQTRAWSTRIACAGLFALTLTSCSSGGGDAEDPGGTKKSGGNDTTPPLITGVGSSPDRTTAVISWRTDEDATSIVAYGETASLELGTVTELELVTSHRIELKDLKPDTEYHFGVASIDEAKNEAVVSGFKFKTTATPDTTPPKLTNLVVTPDIDSCTLTWDTDEPATTFCEYGLSRNYTANAGSTELVTKHQVRLTGLQPNTTYYFICSSADARRNAAHLGHQTFQTKNRPDTTPPQLSAINVTATHDFASVTWTTNEIANSKVEFGLAANNYTQNYTRPEYVTSHQIDLRNLTPNTTYHYRVTSVDPSGNGTAGQNLTFTTKDRPTGGGSLKTSISQFGITWTFDKPYTVGQFANGDWWVVGPVKIVRIDPASATSGRVMNGSMINPDPKLDTDQGYDSAMSHCRYKANLNVAAGVSSARPLTVAPNSSLVSTRSLAEAKQRSQIKGASVLTVLPTEAPAGAFRPPYCGNDKTVKFNKSQLNYSLLLNLDPTKSAPTRAKMERAVERVWLDHIHQFMGQNIHPSENMKVYARDMSGEMGDVALMLHTKMTNAEKEVLMIRFVQLGIDLMGILDAGGKRHWKGNGGHGSGRKWPILFAGIVLNDSHMKTAVTDKSNYFGEDQQTFYVEETSPGVFNYGKGGYNASHKGMPEWGMTHATDPNKDTVEWGKNPYRVCCTANCWTGFVLCARLMKVQHLWKHDALFDYQDRYIDYAGGKGTISNWMVTWSPWQLEMWRKYRPQY